MNNCEIKEVLRPGHSRSGPPRLSHTISSLVSMRERVNWKVAAPITVIGAILALGGLAVAGFNSASVSSLLLNLGSAVALIALVVALEPRLTRQVRRVVEGATAEAVERSTSEIRERVERLEDLERAQLDERERRRAERDAGVERLRHDVLSPSAVGEILAAAHDEHLFDGREFRVRTSPRPDAHVLFMLPLRAANGIRVMWLDFEPIDDGDEVDLTLGVPLPHKREATVMWINDEPASSVASQLESGLERLNEPLRDFSLAFALERLVESVRVMREARSAEEGSPLRLTGALRMLINDRWAFTSFGLEAVHDVAAFPARSAGFRGGPPGAVLWKGCVSNCERPNPEPEAEWREAIAWLRDREGFDILRPGEQQPHPVSRLRQQRST